MALLMSIGNIKKLPQKYKDMWQKYITRRIAVQVAQAWNYGWGNAMKKVYGLSVINTLVVRDAQKTEYYVDKQQFEKYTKGLYSLLEKKSFLKKFHKEALQTLEDILELIQNGLRTNLAKKQNIELVRMYRTIILPNVTQFYIRMWTVFNIGEPLANTVEKNLRKCITDEKKITDYLLRLSTPLEPNDVLHERMALLKIAQQKSNLTPKELDKKFAAHTKKYRHIPMFDFDHEPYTKEHFIEELSKIQKPENELHALQQQFKEHRKDFEHLKKELPKDAMLQELIKFLKENVWLRDYRDMIRQKLNLELRTFYCEAGIRIGLSVEEIATLTNQEIIEYLKKGARFPRHEIEKRKQAYLLIQKGSRVEIQSGSVALRRAIKEIKPKETAVADVLKGIIASKGIARGPAVIVQTNKDLGKVKDGDILVAPITRQDFIPAIRKVKAMVIDEGSITAHPAIIAREFGIPCLVATKAATQVFKDGDIIEVDAIKGCVTRIVS